MKSTEEALSIGGAFEFLMVEWHVTPDYIVNNWTDELFDLMVEKLIERKLREAKPTGSQQESRTHTVPVETLAKMSRNLIKVVKRGD